MSPTLAVLAGVVLLILSALLAAADGVLAALTTAKASSVEDPAQAEALVTLLADRPQVNGSVIVTRIAAQAGVVAVTVAALVRGTASIGVWVGVLGAVGLAVAAAEVLVRARAVSRPERMAGRLLPLIGFVRRLPPLGQLGGLLAATAGQVGNDSDQEENPEVSEQELLALAGVAVEADVLEAEEQALIASIIEFGDTIVRLVMVPRPDMVTFERDYKVADAIEIVMFNGFSRVPVTGEGIDDIVGIAYVKDLVKASRNGLGDDPIGAHLRQARVVPEQKRVTELMREMQQEQFHMAIVVDEYGGTAGLVTLEDLIEELVGEIVDEFDVEEPLAEPLPGGAVRVNARMPLDEASELLDVELPEGDWDTVGGLLFGLLGHVPVQNESVEVAGHRLVAAKVQGRRIGRVRIEPLEEAPPAPTSPEPAEELR